MCTCIKQTFLSLRLLGYSGIVNTHVIEGFFFFFFLYIYMYIYIFIFDVDLND